MSETGTIGHLSPALEVSRAVPTCSWSEFTHQHAQRRERALAIAAKGSLSDAFEGWAFADRPQLLALATRWLEDGTPHPDPAAWRAAMAVPEGLPAPGGSGAHSDRHHRAHLARASDEQPDPDRTRAWAVAELGWLGREIEIRERAAWRAVSYRALPEADARAAEVWASWFSGTPWNTRDQWEADALPAARRSFRAVCAARKLPPDVIDRAVGDLQDAFFFQLLGGGEGTPGWVDVAARTLETRLPGPVVGLVDVLDKRSWARVARCAVQRGGWQRTLRELESELPEPLARARQLFDRIEGGEIEALLDLHVASRIVSGWETGSQPWAVVTQNRGRARGRLRAVLAAAEPEAWLEALLGLHALHARTVAAVRRFAWSWAWDQLARDFSFDFDRSTTAPCVAPDDLGVPLPASAVRTWVLLAILRGRLGHLTRWVRTGSTGDRDSTWARLLVDHCPPPLRDPSAKGPAAYRALRADLSASLDGHTGALRPALEAIAGASGRSVADQVRAVVTPLWDDRIPQLTRGFPSIVRAVNDALERLDQEDPCSP